MIQLERRRDGLLKTGEHLVKLVRCFPWTYGDRFLSLLNEEGKEVGLIREAQDLDPQSRTAVHFALADAGFLLEIEKVVSIEEEFQLRTWVVVTQQGPRRFQTPLDDWPMRLPDQDGLMSLLIRDVNGDLYRFQKRPEIDPRTLELLWPFFD